MQTNNEMAAVKVTLKKQREFPHLFWMFHWKNGIQILKKYIYIGAQQRYTDASTPRMFGGC